jgi:hypothetical protein
MHPHAPDGGSQGGIVNGYDGAETGNPVGPKRNLLMLTLSKRFENLQVNSPQSLIYLECPALAGSEKILSHSNSCMHPDNTIPTNHLFRRSKLQFL